MSAHLRTAPAGTPGPNLAIREELLPRRKRVSRTLSYLSCSFCRKAKVKCVPEERLWPSEKCRRCKVKGLECSAAKRKTPATAQDTSAHLAGRLPRMLEATHGEKDDSQLAHDALVLLSIQFMLQMAVEEIYTLCEELLQDLRSRESYAYHAGKADEAAMWHKDLIQSLKQELQGMPLSVMRLLLGATQDVACIQPTANNDELLEQNTLIDDYEAKGHLGIACALQMARIHKNTDLLHEAAEDERFMQSRTWLLEEWGKVFCKYQFDTSDGYIQLKKRGLDLLHTQLFIPRAALKLPTTLNHLRCDGRIDLIGRSIHFMECDARITEPSPWLCSTDHDCSGRNLLHMICLRDDYILFTRPMYSTSAYRIYESGVWLGLTPLGIATCKGRTGMVNWLLNIDP